MRLLEALVLGPVLTFTSPVREITRVYSQIPTHEWIKVKRKIATPWSLVLLDTKCFKSSKTERNNRQRKHYYIRPKHCHYGSYYVGLTLSWRKLLSHRNQSIELQSKSMDWFLYDNGLRHERVRESFLILDSFTNIL